MEELRLDLDRRGNVKAPVYGTKVEGVFGAAMPAQASRSWSPRSPRGAAARASWTSTSAARRGSPVSAEAMFAYEDGDPHSLRHQAEIARTTVGDAPS